MAVSALEYKSRWGEDRNLFMLSTSYISNRAENTFYHSEISYDQFRETQTLITSSLYWSCCNYSPTLCPPALSFSASCSGALIWELDYERVYICHQYHIRSLLNICLNDSFHGKPCLIQQLGTRVLVPSHCSLSHHNESSYQEDNLFSPIRPFPFVDEG